MESGSDLLSRAVSSQVPSALKGLTSVFGMGTGVTPSLSPPEWVIFSFHTLTTAQLLFLIQFLTFLLSLFFQSVSLSSLKSSPRPISIIKLHTLPHFHR